jgi:hypothetical protein
MKKEAVSKRQSQSGFKKKSSGALDYLQYIDHSQIPNKTKQPPLSVRL